MEQGFQLGSLLILPDHIKYVEFCEVQRGTIDICLGEPYNTTVHISRTSKDGIKFMMWLYPLMEDMPVGDEQ